MTKKDKKELDIVLQIIMPDYYYVDMRIKLIPYIVKWHEYQSKKDKAKKLTN